MTAHKCPVCEGTTKREGVDCPACKATGVVWEPRKEETEGERLIRRMREVVAEAERRIRAAEPVRFWREYPYPYYPRPWFEYRPIWYSGHHEPSLVGTLRASDSTGVTINYLTPRQIGCETTEV